MIFGSWDIRHDRVFCHSGLFFPFYPLTTQEMKIKKKKEKNTCWHFLHMYPTNHMMDASLDVEQNRQNCFVILDQFFPFYPLKTQKIKIFKKWKKSLKISLVYIHNCTIIDNHMMYDSSDMKCNRIFCYSGTFFALLPH